MSLVIAVFYRKSGHSLNIYRAHPPLWCSQVFRRHKHSSAHEEAFLLVGALADKMEKDFAKYMPQLHEILLNALKNYEDAQVSGWVTLFLTGRLAKASGRRERRRDLIVVHSLF